MPQPYGWKCWLRTSEEKDTMWYLTGFPPVAKISSLSLTHLIMIRRCVKNLFSPQPYQSWLWSWARIFGMSNVCYLTKHLINTSICLEFGTCARGLPSSILIFSQIYMLLYAAGSPSTWIGYLKRRSIAPELAARYRRGVDWAILSWNNSLSFAWIRARVVCIVKCFNSIWG